MSKTSGGGLPNARRIADIPIIGTPSAATPNIQFDDTTGTFIYVAASSGGGDMSGIEIDYYQRLTTTSGKITLAFDASTDIAIIPKGNTVASGVSKTITDTKGAELALQAPTGRKFEVMVTVIPTIGATQFKIRASDTVDTADGAIVFEATNNILINQGITTSVVTIPSGKFLTMQVNGANAIDFIRTIVIEKPN